MALFRSRALFGVVSAAVLAAQTVAIPASADSGSGAAAEQVVVLFKDQIPDHPATRDGIPARRAAVAADQQPTRDYLTAHHARDVHSFTSVNAISATVTPVQAAQLAADPSVARVVKNVRISQGPPASTPAKNSSGTTGSSGLPAESGSSADACPGPNDPPQLEPESLQLLGVDSQDPHARTARSLGYDGAGVTVGIIADRPDLENADFIRADGSHVITDYEDFTGYYANNGPDAQDYGGESFLDASSVAAQGRTVYDVSTFGALHRATPCRIRVEGVAPGARLVILDPFGPLDGAYLIPTLQAMDYALTVAHVDVLNESFGAMNWPDDPGAQDAMDAANDAAVAAGVTVTVCSGDEGGSNTITDIASNPNVIDVGGTTSFRAALQTSAWGARLGASGWLSDNITSLSSSGFTEQGTTLTLVAPADLGWMVCTPDVSRFFSCQDTTGAPSAVIVNGGTSMSAPLVAGVAALVIQAYASAHHGAKPGPALIKQILTSTADDIDAPAEQQGSGLVDAYRAVLAARASAPAPATSSQHSSATSGDGQAAPTVPLLEGTGQFNSVAAAGTVNRFIQQVTNLGSRPVTVQASSRALGAYARVKTATVTLDDATSPKVDDWYGISVDNYAKITFTVPAGADRLETSVIWQGARYLGWAQPLTAGFTTPDITLIDPRGRLANASAWKNGSANHHGVQVSDPLAGTWTAYVVGWNSVPYGGWNGPVQFEASVAHYVPFGTVTPSTLTIPAGQTRSVTLSVTTPATPGDVAGSLVLSTLGQPAQTAPVTLRTLVARSRTSFSTTLTGAEGSRGGEAYEAATTYYQVDVPPSAKALNVNVSLHDDPDDQFYVFLIDPSGQSQAFQSNGVLAPGVDGTLGYTGSLGAGAHTVTPAPGRWTIVVDFEPAISGKEFAEQYTVAVDEIPTPVTAPGLPRGQKLPAGKTSVVNVRVTNNGAGPEAYFLDARLSTLAEYSPLPWSVDQFSVVSFLVPSRSTALTVTWSNLDGTTPLQMELAASGDPDLASGAGVTESLTATGAPLMSGLWATDAWLIGPFHDPVAPGTASLDAVLTTQAFDTSVSAPTTGDPWLWSVGLDFDAPIGAVVAQPGQTISIPVQITPNAPAGTVITGTLDIDDESPVDLLGGFEPNANTVATMPYSYTVS
jgi:hypothetical protein